MFGVIMLFALAGPIVDLIVRKRVHLAYAWGVRRDRASAILMTAPLAFTPPALALLKLVQGA
jgi:hypothetical protein